MPRHRLGGFHRHRHPGVAHVVTGAIGLELAITLSVVQAHGSELTLASREGALRARLSLPC